MTVSPAASSQRAEPVQSRSIVIARARAPRACPGEPLSSRGAAQRRRGDLVVFEGGETPVARRDCFVATLLAMTAFTSVIASEAKQSRQIRRDCHGSLARLGNLAMTALPAVIASAANQSRGGRGPEASRCRGGCNGNHPETATRSADEEGRPRRTTAYDE